MVPSISSQASCEDKLVALETITEQQRNGESSRLVAKPHGTADTGTQSLWEEDTGE